MSFDTGRGKFCFKECRIIDLREPRETENFIDLNADDLPF